MQPYFFPYIGYFQLMNAVDIYVIADDLHFMKNGYIKKNSILDHGVPVAISLQLIGASQNKLINEIEVGENKEKILTGIQRRYARASYFKGVFPLLQEIILNEEKNLAKYLGSSLIKTADYLGIETKFIYSSQIEKDNTLKFDARIIEVCRKLNADHYINAIGGKKLYDKKKFSDEGIKLNFIDTQEIKYKQFDYDFIPNLSIIDVMMFNSKSEIQVMLNRYRLV